MLSRTPAEHPWRVVPWNGTTIGPWATEIDGADAVINLAGRSVNCRYTRVNRDAIMSLRIDSTRVVGTAIAQAKRPPRLWIQSSTATIYAHRYDAANDEATGVIGGQEPGAPPSWHFSIDVATAWERTFEAAETPCTRKVALRSAMTMSPDAGGIFATLLALTRRGLGGTAGDGRQFFSWIHHVDFVRTVEWLIEHEEVEGPINVASPEPLPNRQFMRILREAAGVRAGLPASRWMLEAGAVVMGTETELLLKSRRVVPRRLLDAGFTFHFPRWTYAARDLVAAAARGVRHRV